VGNREEAAIVVGECDPEVQAERLLALGLEWVVVTRGPAGVLVAWEGGMERIPPVPVDVVNGLGAGDAFGAALCHGLLNGWEIVTTIRFANAPGASVGTKLSRRD